MKSRTTRRDFLRRSALAGGSLCLAGPSAAQLLARERYARDVLPLGKLNVAVIGCGGKGYSDMKAMRSENIVALCDVDEKRAARAFREQPEARRYEDFRELLDREKELDAVVISTPDRTHAVAAAMAMQQGLHVFCQKPLTHSVEEARVLRRLAARTGVVTQMGNQGTAMEGLRRAVEVVRSGALGAVREVHIWTNRPIWPQGVQRPTEVQAIPTTLRWDLWLGPAAYRPYHGSYCPFNWRGWWDFGTGALGDMACHTMNMAYLALELDAPTSVEAESEGMTEESPPKASTIRFEFPARGERLPVTLLWYDGGRMPKADLFPDGYLKDGKMPKSGTVLVGEKGLMHSTGDYGAKFRLLPEERFADYVPPEPWLPRSPGIHEEWLAACKGGATPMSSFEHAGRFTEAVLLGNVALRTGQKIEWDPVAMRVTNVDEANRWVRDDYRWGWDLSR